MEQCMSGVQRVLEVGLILCGAFAIFLFLALASFNPADPSWSQTGYEGTIHNAAGAIGAWFADALLFAFGFVAYLIPFGLAALGYFMFRQPHRLLELDFLAVGLRLIGLVLTLVGASALASMNFTDIYSFSAGGVVGDVISSSLLPYFNLIGTTLLLLTFLCTGLTLVTGISWMWLADKIGEMTILATLWLVQSTKRGWGWLKNRKATQELERSQQQQAKVEELTPSKKTVPATTIRQEPELDFDLSMSALDDDAGQPHVESLPAVDDQSRFAPKPKTTQPP